jgi:hypothetical protein
VLKLIINLVNNSGNRKMERDDLEKGVEGEVDLYGILQIEKTSTPGEIVSYTKQKENCFVLFRKKHSEY